MAQSALRILLVEDDEVDREIVHRLLEPEYQVWDAATGQEAFALLDGEWPDCAILDYRLPDIDGAQLIPTLAALPIPVVILTGVENPETIVKALQQGAQDYLVKHHLTRTGLMYAIGEAIKKVALQQAIAQQQAQLAAQAQALEQKNKQISQLASALTLAEQQERRRIAHVLHDDLQQILYGIQMRAHLLGLDISLEANPAVWEQLEGINKMVTQAIQRSRTLSSELSPPVLPAENLRGIFQWLAMHMMEMHGLALEVQIDENCTLTDLNRRILIFHVVRELLFNVIKHAGVKAARIIGSGDEAGVTIRVEDQGIGFTAESTPTVDLHNGFGLESVRQRLQLLGGNLEILSESGIGSQVLVTLPRQ